MFKDKLMELRKNNKDTQESLAKKINVSRSLVAKWEQGRAYPTNEDLESICKVYLIEYEELMNSKELKNIYGIINNSNKKKNIIIVVLSIMMTFLSLIFILINYVPIKKKDNIFEKEVITILNYKDKQGFIGESSKNNFMKNTQLYTWEWFQIYRYKLSDISSVYYFHYMAEITPGVVATMNNEDNFDEAAYLEEINLNIKFNKLENINPIFEWPNKNEHQYEFNSKYSSNIIFEDIKTIHNVSLNKKDDKIILYYNNSEDLLNILMQPNLNKQWKEFDNEFNYNDYNWNYKMLTYYSKWSTSNVQSFCMFEIDESKLKEFSFEVDKRVITKSDNKYTTTNHKTKYKCILN